MNGAATETLYELLPAIYRLRDAEQGDTLRALLAIIEEGFHSVKTDVGDLYDNWFIETCAEWAVPYIGDLLGVRPLLPVSSATDSARAYVAHTLAYRRGKGTAATLEQLASDITGWAAHVVEFFQLLALTQYLNHIRPAGAARVDVRNSAALELVGGPFERAAHTADVRRIATNRGKYNVPNLGIFIWRLQSYAIEAGATRAATSPADGRYRFHPVGIDAPLFNQPKPKTAGLAAEVNVPGALRRRSLYDELEMRRQALVAGRPVQPVFFDSQPPLEVVVDGTPILHEQVMICDLSDLPAPSTDWKRPPGSKTYVRSSDGAQVSIPIALAVDPVLGRLAFPAGATPTLVQVSYSYGFSGDLGGGPYDRRDTISPVIPGMAQAARRWQVAVSKTLPPAPNLRFPSLLAAVQAWNAQPPGTSGIIAVLDSQTYAESLTAANQIVVPQGSELLIVAADWPDARPPGVGADPRLAPVGVRPHVAGDVSALGTAAAGKTGGKLIVNGLLIEGAVTVQPGNLSVLQVDHCTLLPDRGGLHVAVSAAPGQNNDELAVLLARTITGPVVLDGNVPTLRVTDSIVASGGGSDAGAPAITAAGAAVEVQGSSILGTASARRLEAGSAIFTGPVTVERRQIGCVRFCFVPAASRTPRRYRCQPDLALRGVGAPTVQAAIRARIAPQFTDLRYGQPGYAQLSPTCAVEIRTGADDGSEMGAFSFLKQPQREGNLRASLDEYLRVGLEAGLIYVT